MAPRAPICLAFVGLVCVIAGCAAHHRDGASVSKSEDASQPGNVHASVASAVFDRSVPDLIDRQWVEQELAREVLHALEPNLGKMGLDSPEGRELVARIVPAAMSERMRVEAKASEQTMLFVRETDAPEWREVKKWLEELHGEATSRAFTTPGGSWPVNSGVVGPLPDDPVLRVMLALQMDWLGVYANYVDDPNPKPAPKDNKKRRSLAEEMAERQPPRKAPMDGPETPEQLAEYAAKIAACRETSATLISDALAQAVASPAFEGERIQLLGLVVVRLTDRDFDRPTHLRAAELYAARPDADRWLANLYRGIVLLEMAWDARGHAYAAETSQEQFAEFQQGLDACYEPLKAAYASAPRRPHTLGPLISQALGSRNPAHEPPEHWFEIAVKVDPTWSDAVRAMTSVVLDRWGGDPEDRVRLIRRLQEASRVRGGGAIAMRAPDLLYRALEDNPGLKEDAKWSLEYQTCLQPLWINSTEDTASFTGVDPDEAWSMALVCAIMAGDVITTWAVLDEPGHRFIPSDAGAFTMTYADVERWAMVRHPTDGAKYREMWNALVRSDIDSAAIVADDLAKTTKSPRMAEAAQRVLATRAVGTRLDAGETIDLLEPSLRVMWQGAPSLLAASVRDPDGLTLERVVLGAGEEDELRFPLALKGRLRIEMEVELPPRQTPSEARLTVRMSNPMSKDAPASLKVFVFNTSIQSMMGDRARRSREGFPLKIAGEKHTIVIEADGPRGCLLVDGKVWDVYEPSPALGKAKTPPAIEGLLGVSGVLPQPDASIRIRSIRVFRPAEPLGERQIDAIP